ncbi:unnamed protein product, partial [Coregonus sp. 'balchen']
KSPYLMFTNRHEIRRIDLVKKDYTQVVPTLKNAVALDLATIPACICWYHSEPASAYINKASDLSEQVTLIETALTSPEGLAVDWVHKNIYWTDSGDKTISVATGDGKKRRILIATELSEPRAIAVDPRQGSSVDSSGSALPTHSSPALTGRLISSCFRLFLISSLYLSNRRLYWVDSKLHLLSSIDLNGDNRKVLLSSQDHLGHPFALTVFEVRREALGEEDEEERGGGRGQASSHRCISSSAVFCSSQHPGKNKQIKKPLQFQRFKPLVLTPDSCNMGSLPNGGCEYLCLKAPQITDHSPKYTCACPDDMELGPDMRRCVIGKLQPHSSYHYHSHHYYYPSSDYNHYYIHNYFYNHYSNQYDHSCSYNHLHNYRTSYGHNHISAQHHAVDHSFYNVPPSSSPQDHSFMEDTPLHLLIHVVYNLHPWSPHHLHTQPTSTPQQYSERER